MIIQLVKEILKEKNFLNLFNDNMDNQPLSLYKWTNNSICSSLKETRKKYLKKLQDTINKYFNDLIAQNVKRSTLRVDLRSTTHRSTNNKSMIKSSVDSGKEKYGEELENKIDQKYLKEIGDKYKYKINEMNEKIIILNKETKRAIIDTAVENTLYNIVSDSANGNIDLTEKQRIYFFLDKSLKSIETNNNQHEISKNIEQKEEKEENKINDNKGIKEEEKNE